jgi:hypothetical protein
MKLKHLIEAIKLVPPEALEEDIAICCGNFLDIPNVVTLERGCIHIKSVVPGVELSAERDGLLYLYRDKGVKVKIKSIG